MRQYAIAYSTLESWTWTEQWIFNGFGPCVASLSTINPHIPGVFLLKKKLTPKKTAPSEKKSLPWRQAVVKQMDFSRFLNAAKAFFMAAWPGWWLKIPRLEFGDLVPPLSTEEFLRDHWGRHLGLEKDGVCCWHVTLEVTWGWCFVFFCWWLSMMFWSMSSFTKEAVCYFSRWGLMRQWFAFRSLMITWMLP